MTETALTTALNNSCFAESVATFSAVMGFALLLAGIGFLVLLPLAVRWLRVVARRWPTSSARGGHGRRR